MDARGPRHVLVHDVVNAPRDLGGRQPELCREPLDGGARRFHVHPDLPAREVLGVQIAEQEIRIGHGGLRAAEAIRGRPWMRARAARPHLEEADLVDVRDAASARADLDQLDGGDAHGQPAALDEPPLPGRLEAVGDEGLTSVDQGELGRGAAHVEGEKISPAVLATEEGGSDGARGGARLEHLHRGALRLADVGEPTAREHEEQRRGNAQLGHALRHQLEIALGQRLDVRVADRGRGALELTDLRGDFVRGGDGHAAVALRDQPGGLRFVAWIGIGVQEDDRDRRDARLDERRGSSFQRAGIERAPDAAVGLDTLGHLEAQVARHERLGLGDGEVVELVLPLAPDLERVGEAFGGDEPGRRALPLDQGVGEERGGMHHARKGGRLEAAAGEQRRHAGGHCARGVVVSGEDLAAHLAARVMVVDDDVGERAADIDPERVLGHRLT